jgi:hypothetical protein
MNRKRAAFWIFAVIAGALQCWSYRFWIEPDGINYLDVASAYTRHDWTAAISTYWSPLYSWLLAIVLAIFHPPLYWESTTLHLLNFVIFLAALRFGAFFIAELIRSRQEEGLLAVEATWWITACLLLFVSLFMVAAYLDTPDLLMSAFVYAAGGLLLRIRRGDATLRTYVLFGIVLGFAYLAKTIMFLVALAFLAEAAPRRKVLLSFACFAGIAAVWILVMAHSERRFTFGDSGWTNYDLYVAGSGSLIHPVRILYPSPEVREFAAPIRSTYPWGYDPPYWMAGLHPHFSWRAQTIALNTVLRTYVHMLSGMKEFLAALIVLLLLSPTLPKVQWAILLPPIMGLLLYAAVGHVESRLAGGFFVVFWAPIFAGLRVKQQHAKLAGYVAVFVAAITFFKVTKTAVRLPYNTPNVQWNVAIALRNMGVGPDSEVADFRQNIQPFYWARLGGLRIVADLNEEDIPAFWTAAPAVQERIFSRLSVSGVTAIIAETVPATAGWQPIAGTPYSIYLCRAP